MTKIKNEADIVESFVRYHKNVFDEMYFIDNGSCDGTIEILKQLKEEGIPIYLYDENCSEMETLRFANEYLYKIFDKTKCDWIIPIDTDEFFCERSGKNPRIFLEETSQDEIVSIKWRTYICDSEKRGDVFIPKQYTLYRDESVEEYDKLLVPGKILEKKKFLLREGYHKFQSIEKIKVKYVSNLFYAHYPIRSTLQLKKQMLINGINIIHNGNAKRTSGHWRKIYAQIKEGNLEIEAYSKGYAVSLQESENIAVLNGMITTDFCKNTEIKYAKNANMNVEDCLVDLAERLAIKKRILELQVIAKEKDTSKKKILIWGVSQACKRDLTYINSDKYEVLAFVDSDYGKAYSVFEGKIVLPPEKVNILAWDYIVIAPEKYYVEIREMAEKVCDVTKIKAMCEILIEEFIG